MPKEGESVFQIQNSAFCISVIISPTVNNRYLKLLLWGLDRASKLDLGQNHPLDLGLWEHVLLLLSVCRVKIIIHIAYN